VTIIREIYIRNKVFPEILIDCQQLVLNDDRKPEDEGGLRAWGVTSCGSSADGRGFAWIVDVTMTCDFDVFSGLSGDPCALHSMAAYLRSSSVTWHSQSWCCSSRIEIRRR
jgi:hypothetical protein